jgi:hypothetical protein
VLRRISDPTGKVNGGWIKTHGKELHNFYSTPNIIRIIK